MLIISLHIKREGGGIDTSRVEDRVSGKRETAFTGNEQVNVMIILLCICDPYFS